MTYHITHQTCYRYSESVSLCHNEARMTPRSFGNQTCLNSHLDIAPDPVAYREREDFFGNRTTYFAIEQPHITLTLKAVSTVHIIPLPALQDPSEPSWQVVRDQVQTDHTDLEIRQFTLDSPMIVATPDLRGYAEPSFPPDRPIIEAVRELMRRIYTDFKYVPGFTTIATPLSDVFEHRQGVCQDFAHLSIGCLRALGLPARYISGYLETLPPEGKARLVGADASHAWFSIFIPPIGWIDFDPTNNLLPSDQHITLAWGRDFADVTPLKGVIFGSGEHDLDVAVDVEPIDEKHVPPS